jgi:hypothetical protein
VCVCVCKGWIVGGVERVVALCVGIGLRGMLWLQVACGEMDGGVYAGWVLRRRKTKRHAYF